DGEAAGVWVNSADDPDHCSFTLPAVVRRGPLMVAVSTGGRSPALASWLKQRLAAEIGPEYEVLADLLAAEREAVRADGRSTEGLNWQKALDSDMLELIRTAMWPMQGSACRRVCRRRRIEPSHRPARVARASQRFVRAAAQGPGGSG